jgi:Mrp family chromosome partitioning ATPase
VAGENKTTTSMDGLAGKERKVLGIDEQMTDSRNERCAGEENDETNLGVEAEFAGDVRGGRKSSPNLRRKFAGTQAVDKKLRRGVEGATSGGSQ